jgi:putative endonuclease
MSTSERGARVEAAACRLLRRRGLKLLSSNFRSKYGELDLVMRDADCVVFVEVRYRRSERFGGAAMSVDQRKQLRLRRTAEYFLRRHPKLAAQPCRFDVVCASGCSADPELEWIQRAF